MEHGFSRNEIGRPGSMVFDDAPHANSSSGSGPDWQCRARRRFL